MKDLVGKYVQVKYYLSDTHPIRNMCSIKGAAITISGLVIKVEGATLIIKHDGRETIINGGFVFSITRFKSRAEFTTHILLK